MDNLSFYQILFSLALILVLSKLLSIGCRKIGLPQVIGLLFTGIILGLITLIPNQNLISNDAKIGISFLAEIGVVLIMFSAGLETDIKQVKETGGSALVITILGVLIPLGLGFVVSLILSGDLSDPKILFRNLFYGIILTATSVSVTVASLKELGRLKTPIGTAIVSAAILDDIIGVIILSVIISLDGALANGNTSEIGKQIGIVLGKTALFFVFAIAFGILIRIIFKKLSNRYDHHRRLPIFALAFAFFYAYAAEAWFGIADITGAFFAGIFLSGTKDSGYIEKRADTTSYLIFTPVFFAKVGLTSISSFSSIDPSFIAFGLLFILAGIAGKLLGCGIGAKITKYSFKDSIRCGVGMMVRAEVCLISAQKGIDAGIISASIQPFILVLILITSFAAPIILKATYKNEAHQDVSDIATIGN